MKSCHSILFFFSLFQFCVIFKQVTVEKGRKKERKKKITLSSKQLTEFVVYF